MLFIRTNQYFPTQESYLKHLRCQIIPFSNARWPAVPVRSHRWLYRSLGEEYCSRTKKRRKLGKGHEERSKLLCRNLAFAVVFLEVECLNALTGFNIGVR